MPEQQVQGGGEHRGRGHGQEASSRKARNLRVVHNAFEFACLLACLPACLLACLMENSSQNNKRTIPKKWAPRSKHTRPRACRSNARMPGTWQAHPPTRMSLEVPLKTALIPVHGVETGFSFWPLGKSSISLRPTRAGRALYEPGNHCHTVENKDTVIENTKKSKGFA